MKWQNISKGVVYDNRNNAHIQPGGFVHNPPHPSLIRNGSLLPLQDDEEVVTSTDHTPVTVEAGLVSVDEDLDIFADDTSTAKAYERDPETGQRKSGKKKRF